MKSYRMKYSADAKRQALELADRIGPVKACKRLGINKSTMYNWRQKMNIESKKPVQISTEAKFVKAARAELTKLDMQRQALQAVIKSFG